MHKQIWNVRPAVVLAFSLLTFSVLAHAATSNRQADVQKTSKGDLRITPLYHGSVMFEFGGKTIYVDPWSQGDFTGLALGDLIVVTHTHGDHLDPAQINKLKKPETIIVGPTAVIDTLNCFPGCGKAVIVGDSDKKTVMGIDFEGVPMYNLVNGSAPEMPYHHKGIGSGYVMNFGDALSHTVEFSPALPNQGAFFIRTYQQGSCWYQ